MTTLSTVSILHLHLVLAQVRHRGANNLFYNFTHNTGYIKSFGGKILHLTNTMVLTLSERWRNFSNLSSLEREPSIDLA